MCAKSEETRIPKRSGRRPLFMLLFALLLAFHLLANLWWLANDNHSIQSDESLHMNYAREYYEILVLDQSKSIPLRFVEAFNHQNYYPPLVHLAAAAVLAAHGYNVATIAFTLTIVLLLLIIGVYFISREVLNNPWHALYTTFVASLTPLVFCASRNFMTDYLAALFVVWAVFCLIKSNCFRNTGWVFLFAIINGFGLMSRQTTPFFYLLPCLLLLPIALTDAVQGPRRTWDALKLLALNAAIAITVSAGIALPWYLHHFDFLREFWATHFYVGKGLWVLSDEAMRTLAPRAAVALLVFAVVVVAARLFTVWRAKTDPGQKTPSPWIPVSCVLGTVAVFAVLIRFDQWAAYAVLLIEDGVFLPLFVLAIFGMFRALHVPYRGVPAMIAVTWLLGSYILLTVLFRSQVPRYFVPAAPAIGLFAGLGICAIRGVRARRGAMAVLAVFLLFQYGNLTFASYGPLANAILPSVSKRDDAPKLAQATLPLYKDRIIAGNYAFHPAQANDGFADRILKTMVKDMVERRPIYEDAANYQRLTDQAQFEGLWFAERHYWPLPNPFALSDQPLGMRPLRAMGTRWQAAPEDLLSHLDQTDFVTLKVEVSDNLTHPKSRQDSDQAKQKLDEWTKFFEERDFQVIDSFFEERYNNTAGGLINVMGRRARELEVVKSWNFATLDANAWDWQFGGGAAAVENGALRKTTRSGPVASIKNVNVAADEFSAVRVELEAYHPTAEGPEPVIPESMHFYWARPRDILPGGWPFDNSRGVRFRQAGDRIWEASMSRRPTWNTQISQAMIGMDLPMVGLSGMRNVAHWDFTTLPKAQWDWRFERAADQAPHGEGALVMIGESGPLLRLDNVQNAKDIGVVQLRLETFLTTRSGSSPVPIKQAFVHWAGPREVENAGFPFDEIRREPFRKLEDVPGGRWLAPVAANPNWNGDASALLIAVDLPVEMLTRNPGHFTVFTKEVAFLNEPGSKAAFGEVHIVMKKIEFMN